MQRLTVVHVRLFSEIGHVMTKIDWEEPMKMYTPSRHSIDSTLIQRHGVDSVLGRQCVPAGKSVGALKYDVIRKSPAAAGPVADSYLNKQTN